MTRCDQIPLKTYGDLLPLSVFDKRFTSIILSRLKGKGDCDSRILNQLRRRQEPIYGLLDGSLDCLGSRPSTRNLFKSLPNSRCKGFTGSQGLHGPVGEMGVMFRMTQKQPEQ